MTPLRSLIFIGVYVPTCKNFTHNYREYAGTRVYTRLYALKYLRVELYIATLHFQLMEVVDWNEIEARSGGLKHS